MVPSVAGRALLVVCPANSGNREVSAMKLVCIDGMNKNDEFPILDGMTTIGRSADCDVTVFDKKCSRRHATIEQKGKKAYAEDANSRNGTTLNGKPLTKRTQLNVGDKVKVGKTVLLVSDKPLGDMLQQTATGAMSDLEVTKFDQLMDVASAEARQAQAIKHQQSRDSVKHGLKDAFLNMFRKKE